MTQLTVREALTIDGLQSVKVLAGRAGLDRTITCVNIMEVPDILQWVRGGELLLTTTYPLKDSRVSLRELIPLLNEKGLAALAIKPHRYLEEIPGEILEVADSLSLPVLELSTDASFVDLINVVLTRILNFQAELLLRSEEIHKRFTSVVLEGGGLTEIADLLSSILDKPVTIFDVDGDVLASAPRDRHALLDYRISDLAPAAGNQPPEIRDPQWHGLLQRKVLRDPTGEIRAVQRSIRTGRLHYGEIVVWETGAPIKETDLMAMDHASTVAALALSKSRAVSQVELRFRNDFLNDLLSGNIRDLAALPGRAQALGWRLHGPYAIIMVEIEGLQETHDSAGESKAGSILETARRIGRMVADTALRLDPEIIVWSKLDSVVLLCPLPSNANAPEARKRATWLATQLRGQVLLDDNLNWTWGIGGFYPGLLDLHKAYSEARLAVDMGRIIGQPGGLNHYDDMGVYRLLHQFPEPSRLLEFATRVLQPMLDYDARHGGQLLATIEAYLSCERNLARTARQLSVHYNTVKYRVQRADTLLEGGLHNSHRRLELELAIKALKLHGK